LYKNEKRVNAFFKHAVEGISSSIGIYGKTLTKKREFFSLLDIAILTRRIPAMAL